MKKRPKRHSSTKILRLGHFPKAFQLLQLIELETERNHNDLRTLLSQVKEYQMRVISSKYEAEFTQFFENPKKCTWKNMLFRFFLSMAFPGVQSKYFICLMSTRWIEQNDQRRVSEVLNRSKLVSVFDQNSVLIESLIV